MSVSQLHPFIVNIATPHFDHNLSTSIASVPLPIHLHLDYSTTTMDTLNNVLTPLKPTLQSLTTNLPSPLQDLALSLLGQQCYRTLLLQLDLSASNSACTQLAISKTLGLAIVSASSIVKIPQLLKLLNSQSAAGLSFLSYLLETASFVITLAYNVRHGFPFSTFGETAFIAVQDVAIAVLILAYSGRGATAAAFVACLAAAGYALFGQGGLVDMEMLGWLQAGAGVLGVASKVPQILTVWREGGTGQLSAFAVFNYLAGSLTRIFTTLQEVDDKMILYGFVAGFAFNAILAAQLVYYWNAPVKGKRKGKKAVQEKGAVDGAVASGATPAKSTRGKGPSTRRKG
ncbi:MAG: hypothetical protein M1828_001574 [Chrysothrix sp. TS-e1954]|nr:MAG: hypothetical protein M1828_001574 [Chrysothrix sp. TS-e1954]